MIDFGMLHLFEHPAGRTEQQVLREQLDIMVQAEDYGFHSVWPAEHHFSEYGYCASPAVHLAYVAARTKRLRLGTGVVVLPLNHPVRVAEDYATLDLISDGRVELGLGRGYQPHEFRGYGVEQSKSRQIFQEGVEVLLRAWIEERFSYGGQFYQFEDLEVRPKPLQKPHPPIWMAALSDDSFALCGRYGFNLLTAFAFGADIDRIHHNVERWREALRREGRDPSGYRAGCLAMTYVAETSQQALADFAEPVLWYYHTFAKYVAPAAGHPPIPTYELYALTRDFVQSVTWEDLVRRGAVVVGSPDQVVDRIGQIVEKTGLSLYLAWIRIGGLDHAKVLKCMELMASKVMPQLKDMGAPVP
jgi:luciferase family oxidoreductase group 1